VELDEVSIAVAFHVVGGRVVVWGVENSWHGF
jgi:hypothetical protein